MKLTDSNLKSIEKVVKNSPEFSNNEDLFDVFFEYICDRTQKVIDGINSNDELNVYLNKITKPAMLTVLKTFDRLKYNRTEEALAPTITKTYKDYTTEMVSYDNFSIDKINDNVLIPTEILGKITKIVSKIDDEEPNNQYLKIYKLRYADGLTQKEIAEIMNLSPAEICTRLFQLMDKVKKLLN